MYRFNIIHTHSHIHTHKHTHTYIHIYTYTYTPNFTVHPGTHRRSPAGSSPPYNLCTPESFAKESAGGLRCPAHQTDPAVDGDDAG